MNCACGNIVENHDTGLCARCSRLQRKAEEAALKPPKIKKAISKVGTKNTFECSDGTRVTEANIKTRLAAAYARFNKIWSYPMRISCWGCGKRAQAMAHIIAKARCKILGKTELIWHQDNLFPACNDCNLAIENPSGEAWKKLKNIDKCLKFIERHDAELFVKFSLNRLTKNMTPVRLPPLEEDENYQKAL